MPSLKETFFKSDLIPQFTERSHHNMLELFFKSQLPKYPFKKKIFRDILLNLRETKTHINDDACQGMCSNTAIVTNLTERFVLNPGCFYCVKREKERDRERKRF